MASRRRGPVTLIAVSGLLAGVVGFVIWMVTDVFVFLPVFLAVGLVTGIALADGQRKQ